MNIYHIDKHNLKKFEKFFYKETDTLILSCLQGYMGSAFTDDLEDPKSVQLITADFCFFAGIPNIALVKNKPKSYESDFVIMVPENKEWAAMIEEVYKDNCKKVTRYSTKKEPHVFNEEILKDALKNKNPQYDIKLIDEEIFNLTRKYPWSEDFCSQYKDYNDFKEKGLGAVAFIDGKMVSGASSYTVYKDGIEIEVDTNKDYRQKGLAYLCCAKLILECISRNLYPSWDAQNKISLSLAEKLGYHFDKEYTVYEIYNF